MNLHTANAAVLARGVTEVTGLDPAMGNLGYERREDDFYATESWVTEAICPHLAKLLGAYGRAGSSIWEPACGEGDMSEVLKTLGVPVYSTDLKNRGYEYQDAQMDFLGVQDVPVSGIRGLVTNPPYGELASQFIRHSLYLMGKVGGFVAMVLRNEYDCAAERSGFFRDSPFFSGKLVLTKRPRWIKGTSGSPRHNYAWYVWDTAQPPGTIPPIRYHSVKRKGH